MMNEPVTPKKSFSFSKKILGIGILMAVVFYCAPELREKAARYLQSIRQAYEEWRETR